MTASGYKVLRAIHSESTDQCVDIFVRKDGSYGFEEFRRDYEEGGAWHSLNKFSNLTFRSIDEAIEAARTNAGWLDAGSK